MNRNRKTNITLMVVALMAIIGTYNAVMINGDSLLSSYDARNFKRLDEALGVVVHGRVPAITTQWSKVGKTVQLSAEPSMAIDVVKSVSNKEVLVSDSQKVSEVQTAAIQESFELNLTDVINPSQWPDTGSRTFNGSISAKDGIIEGLSATLPNGKSIQISFAEMTGNSFEYDLDGEVYSAMIYQVDHNAYVVNLTNGPLEGTRMRFSGDMSVQEQQSQTQQYLAEYHNVEVGTFGQETEVPVPNQETSGRRNQDEFASFNFNQI